ncbi:unnamed protein product [Paramecium sonneborni]|uniref:Uncharacterized protein n=1 Tax=Paramecium sonneborni TaxID=65129 RepID=A0A8S1KP86_9CILI|nr:unnamed protein product [Paramecium sonneborni]
MMNQLQIKRNQSQKSKTQPILKCKNSREKKNRKDRSGNDIISGGNYKISFKDSFIIQKTNSQAPQNVIEDYSDSQLSDYSESQQSQIKRQKQIYLANQTPKTIKKMKQTNCDLKIEIEMNQEFPKTISVQKSKNFTKTTQKSLCCIIF